MRKISEETKTKQNRGEGSGADYIPYINVTEINSKGTTANIVDWKHGRTTQLLSQGEMMAYYYLRWDDDVVDIREQFPLPLERTVSIANNLGYKHPKDTRTRMTTDMLVTLKEGCLAAYSIKDSKKVLKDDRTVEKLTIERTYWEAENIPFKMLYKEDIDVALTNNIRRVVEYYNPEDVHDDISRVKYLIAIKRLEVNMNEELDFAALAEEMRAREWII